jgi:hypothetical protein
MAFKKSKSGLWLQDKLRDQRGFMPGLMPIIGPQGAQLPLANLTLHFDFSDITKLYKTLTPGNNPCYTDQASADSDVIEVAVSSFPTGASELVLRNVNDSNGECPKVLITAPGLPVQCLDYDGTDDKHRLYVRTGDSQVDPYTASIWDGNNQTFIGAFRADTLPANPNDYGEIFGEHSLGVFVVALWHTGGAPKISCIHVNGGTNALNFAVSTGTNYVVAIRHDGSTFYASVNGGSESSVASTGTFGLGHRFGAGDRVFGYTFNGQIGEMACWNTALTGADLTNAITYFTAKWL